MLNLGAVFDVLQTFIVLGVTENPLNNGFRLVQCFFSDFFVKLLFEPLSEHYIKLSDSVFGINNE
jgi:hypothetical protein